MNTIEMLQQQESGLKEKLITLRQKQAILNRAAGIEESAVKAKLAADELEEKAKELRETLKNLKIEKAQALESSIDAVKTRLEMFLPYGNAIVTIDETGAISFGWSINEIPVPYSGLSGGQRVMFDAALSYALLANAKQPVVVLEAAELGSELGSVMGYVQETAPYAQIIVNTCFPFNSISEEETGWKMVKIGGSDDR